MTGVSLIASATGASQDFLSVFASWLVYDVLSMEQGSRLSDTIHFFIYDTFKIFLLLWVMITLIGIMRTWLPEHKIRDWTQNRGILGNFFAAAFGALTPFCSCSSIPLFISFVKAGMPLGVTFSFLITSPLINEYLVVLMFESFGWKISLLYVICGMAIGVTAGYILGKMKLEDQLERDFIQSAKTQSQQPQVFKHFKERLAFGISEANSIVKKIAVWVLVGVGIGAVIHNYVPQESLQAAMESTGIFSVPIATLLGVPMYGSCAAIVPVAVVLFEKGIPLGTALAFMMAMSALSLPEAIMLRRTIKLKLIVIFFGITTLGIILIGYFLNFIQAYL